MRKLKNGGVMDFKEIGRVLGISRQAAWQYYRSGLAKLRQRPEQIQELLELAAERQKIAAQGVEVPS